MTDMLPRTNVTKMVAASQIMVTSYPQRYPPHAARVNLFPGGS